jgi:hypothetical protein
MDEIIPKSNELLWFNDKDTTFDKTVYDDSKKIITPDVFLPQKTKTRLIASIKIGYDIVKINFNR